MNLIALEPLISPARLASYRTVFNVQTDDELLGAYEWNKAVCSVFAPLNSTLEVTLRNAIHNAVSSQFGSNWFLRPRYQSHGSGNTPYEVDKFKNNIRNASNNARNELIRKGLPRRPTNDQIIAKTDFSTWEYILDDEFFDGTDGHYIWPRCLGTAFSVWPNSGSRATLNHIRDQVKGIRLFRNRISHNEPAWKHHSVQSLPDVFAYLELKIASVENLIGWVHPDKLRFMSQQGWFDEARRVCSQANLEYYQQKQVRIPIQDLQHLIDTTHSNVMTEQDSLLLELGQNSIVEARRPKLKSYY